MACPLRSNGCCGRPFYRVADLLSESSAHKFEARKKFGARKQTQPAPSPDFLAGAEKSPARSSGAICQPRSARLRIVSDSLTSASACLVAFLDSALESAVGRSVWMALPKLIDLLPVPTGQADPLAGVCPVMSACMQAKLIPRFLLT